MRKSKDVPLSEKIREAGLVHSDFRAAQATSKRFLLMGQISFNETKIPLKGGTLRFRLKAADVEAVATGCKFDSHSLAFDIVRPDSAMRKVKLIKTGKNDSKKSVELGVNAKIAATPSAKLDAGAARGINSVRSSSRKETFPENSPYSLVAANKSGLPDSVSWRIEPHPNDDFESTVDGIAAQACLFGSRLNDNDGQLAAVEILNTDYRVEIFLEIRRHDIFITEFPFDENKALRDVANALVKDDNRKRVAGRIATEKAISGRYKLAHIKDRKTLNLSRRDMSAVAEKIELIRLALRSDYKSFIDLVEGVGLSPETDFIDADLRGLDLSDEQLVRFNFTRADLRGTNLRGAWIRQSKIKGAIIDQEQIQSLRIVKNFKTEQDYSLEQAAKSAGVRMTEQRRAIAQVLARADDHPDVEEIHRRVIEIDSRVSLATVYRTMRLFEDAGVVQRHDFRDGRVRYEDVDGEEYDHLIDLRDGSVVEFVNEELERLIKRIALELGYSLVDHRLELYAVPLEQEETDTK